MADAADRGKVKGEEVPGRARHGRATSDDVGADVAGSDGAALEAPLAGPEVAWPPGPAREAPTGGAGTAARHAALLHLQRTRGNRYVARLLAQRQGDPPSGAAKPPAAPDGAAAPPTGLAAALIRDDDATDLRPGQMRRSVFVEKLRVAAGDAAEQALAGIPGVMLARPAIDEQIDQQIAAYRDQDSPALERAIRDQVPAAATAASAQALIDAVTQKIRQDVAEHGPGSGGAPQAGSGGTGILFAARDGGARDGDDPAAIQGQLYGGQILDGSVRSGMETAFGQSFSDVRVHSDATAGQLAENLNARAFAVGRDIAFGAGEYRPGTPVGDALIAHELAHVAQQGGNPAGAPQRKGPGEHGALEADADAAAVRAVVALWSGAKGALAGMIQRALPQLTTGLRLQRCNGNSAPKTFPAGVHAIPAARKTRLGLLGDGTAANPGLTFGVFQAYMAQQADWFVEPTLTATDRARLWDLANLKEQTAGLASLKLAELVAAAPADLDAIKAYAAGSAAAAQTVRITRPAPTVARTIQLGKAMRDLNGFVPGPVLRVCIEQATLEKLVDEALLPVLKDYFTRFKPTIENPAEQAPLLTLLRGGLAPYATLVDWVHDLHVFTPATLVGLTHNVADMTRSRPVLLILHSGLDWNKAFLQMAGMEAAVLNATNLALILQGSTSLAAETARVNKIADDYGKIPKPGAKARLGQVVFAGHGEATSVEQATPGTGSKSVGDQYVDYDKENLNPQAPGDASEKLIDTVLSRMDPAAARVVFAGCLVGSHDVADSPDLADPAKAAKAIKDSIKANPNLRDLVEQRMKALNVKGKVEAANASTPGQTFQVDAAGHAGLSLTWDPHLGGSKADYVKDGAEPEGALRAALETWADPALGPAWTTNEMKNHVALFAAETHWYKTLTRTAYKFALPAAGNVNPRDIDDLAHRARNWLDTGWESMASPSNLAAAVKPAEAPVLYPVMLASSNAVFPHLPIVVQEAWMSTDATHSANFRAALDATTLGQQRLSPLLADGLVNPHLATLLATPAPAAPSKGQLLLSLTIAVRSGAAMPPVVKNFLIGAAGGAKTTSFPAALHVPDLLDGASELEILRNIGLAPGASAVPGAPPRPDDANVDVDQDKTNETFVAVDPHQVTVVAPAKDARTKPDATAPVVAALGPGTTTQVVGTSGTWTVVDLGGKIAFVDGKLP